jgi:hypothetical protein
MNEMKYLFTPRSRDRETLPKINPLALEREAVACGDQAGTVRLLKDEPLTLARDLGGSMVLAWLDGRKALVMVEKADVKEVTSWV